MAESQTTEPKVVELHPDLPSTTIDGVAVEVVTTAPQVVTAAASGGVPQVKSIWLDGYLPADAAVVSAWRRDAATRFPARITLEGDVWTCDVVIIGLGWGSRPGLVRIQAQSTGPVAPDRGNANGA